MPLFEIPTRATKEKDNEAAKKANSASKKAAVKARGNKSLIDRIAAIREMVERGLGQYKDSYIIIQDEKVLHEYIDACITNSYISIDTETDGLDPMQNKLAGICIYTRTQKAAYLPINHISYITNEKVSGQLDEAVVRREFERLLETKPTIDMFNAKFDIRVLRNQLGLKDIYCSWDGYLAARLLNENEPQNGLKALHNKYCLQGNGDAFKFDDLFKGILFTMIPLNVGYLYAAHDAEITTQLCDYQRQFLDPKSENCTGSLQGVSWVFHNIEMPCIQVVADMEDNGILFDLTYQAKLSEKYNKLLKEKEAEFYKCCEAYQSKIDEYRRGKVDCKLDNPISIGSPTQIAILLYDILKIEPPDRKSPRGTGEAILQKIDAPITKAILAYREVQKLVSTYIDKLPGCINPQDGRIHCSFNQYGADTGRFSSSEPNLQNIPSHNKDIRKMFVADNSEHIIRTDTKQFVVDRWCEVETESGWKSASELVVGDLIVSCDDRSQSYVVDYIVQTESNIIIRVI